MFHRTQNINTVDMTAVQNIPNKDGQQKVNFKLLLCWIQHHDMNTLGGSEGVYEAAVPLSTYLGICLTLIKVTVARLVSTGGF